MFINFLENISKSKKKSTIHKSSWIHINCTYITIRANSSGVKSFPKKHFKNQVQTQQSIKNVILLTLFVAIVSIILYFKNQTEHMHIYRSSKKHTTDNIGANSYNSFNLLTNFKINKPSRTFSRKVTALPLNDLDWIRHRRIFIRVCMQITTILVAPPPCKMSTSQI